MGFLPTFTERHAKPKDRYTYDLAVETRSKMLHILAQRDGSRFARGSIFLSTMGEVQMELLKRHASLCKTKGRTAGHPAMDHFLACSTEDALSFIELCFRATEFMIGVEPNDLIAELNRTLEADGVGFELTPFRQIWREVPTGSGRPSRQMRREFPEFIKKGERTTHEQAVQPALTLLADPRFATANSELFDAFREVREGKYADAITSCGAAFESVLKTICTEKGWTYNPDKDTLAPLVETCRSHGLFEPFYVELFKTIGMIRNKIGDAHGKGPTPQYKASQNHAEHMIATTCSYITFAIKQAGI